MSLKTFFQSVKSELLLLARSYEVRRLDHGALAPYETLPSLLTKLTSNGELEGRASLVSVLLELHQTKPHRLWGTLLLHAFRPMLRHTRKQLYGGSPDERDALLLAAFSKAVQRVDPHRDPVRIGMYVRQTTRKAVFHELAKEIEWESVGFGSDADLEPDPRSMDCSLLRGAWLCERTHRQPALPGGRKFDLVGTLERGALWSYVRRTYPALDEREKLRLYCRFRQRRRRLIARMRSRLSRQVVQSRVKPPVPLESGVTVCGAFEEDCTKPSGEKSR
jgi:hypothetical protein